MLGTCWGHGPRQTVRKQHDECTISVPVVAVFAGGAWRIVLGVKKSRVQIPPARPRDNSPELTSVQVSGLSPALWPHVDAGPAGPHSLHLGTGTHLTMANVGYSECGGCCGWDFLKRPGRMRK